MTQWAMWPLGLLFIILSRVDFSILISEMILGKNKIMDTIWNTLYFFLSSFFYRFEWVLSIFIIIIILQHHLWHFCKFWNTKTNITTETYFRIAIGISNFNEYSLIIYEELNYIIQTRMECGGLMSQPFHSLEQWWHIHGIPVHLR